MTSDQILDIIQDKKIDIVHIHPLVNTLPAYLAAWRGGALTAATVHGPASLGSFMSAVFQLAIISSYENITKVFVVSPETKRLVEGYGIDSTITPNAVQIDGSIRVVSKSKKTNARKWLIVSRLSGDKIEGVKDIIEKISTEKLGLIGVAGDGDGRKILEEWCANKGYFVEFFGARSDIAHLTKEFDVIAGMGRAYLEGIVGGKLACLIGYDGVKGLLTNEATFHKAAYCNFSGRNMMTIPGHELAAQVSKATKTPSGILSIVENEFSESKNWQNFVETVKTSTRVDDSFAEHMYNLLREKTDPAQPWHKAKNVVGGIITHAVRNNKESRYNQLLVESMQALEEAFRGYEDIRTDKQATGEGVSKRYKMADKIADRFNQLMPHGTIRRKSAARLVRSASAIKQAANAVKKRTRVNNKSFGANEKNSRRGGSHKE